MNEITLFIHDRPGLAVLVVILAFIFLIVFILPLWWLIVLVAFAYAKAYDSFSIGMAISVPVVFVGIMIGSLLAFLLGRYMFADYIKRKIKKSKNPKVKYYYVIDGMFKDRGIYFVALLRLTILPYGLLCYMIAVTNISLLDYMLGSSFYIIKITIFCVLGCSIYEAT